MHHLTPPFLVKAKGGASVGGEVSDGYPDLERARKRAQELLNDPLMTDVLVIHCEARVILVQIFRGVHWFCEEWLNIHPQGWKCEEAVMSHEDEAPDVTGSAEIDEVSDDSMQGRAA